MSAFQCELDDALEKMEEVPSSEQWWGCFKSAVLSVQKNLPELPARKEKEWGHR